MDQYRRSTINEGFWDSLVNKVKGGGLAVGALAGHQHSSGKLDAHNVATHLYNGFQEYLGQTGQKVNPDSIKDFLQNQVGFSDDFTKVGVTLASKQFSPGIKAAANSQAAAAGQQGRPNTAQGRAKASATPNQQTQAPAQQTQAQTSQQPQTAPQSTPQQPQTKPKVAVPPQEVSKAASFVGKAKGTLGADPDSDGGVVFVQNKTLPTYNKLKTEADMDSDDEWADLSRSNEFEKAGLLRSWEKLENDLKSYGIVGDDESTEDVLSRSLAAGKELTGDTFSNEAGGRFVVGVPQKLQESIMMEASGDAMLRKYFQDIAFMAFRKGEAKRAYGSEVQGNHTPTVNFSNTSSTPSQQTSQSNANNTTSSTSSQVNSQPNQSSNNQQRRSRSRGSRLNQQRTKSQTRSSNVPNIASVEVPIGRPIRRLMQQYDNDEILDMIDTKDPNLDRILQNIMAGVLDDYEDQLAQKTNESTDGSTSSSSIASIAQPLFGGVVSRKKRVGKLGDSDE